MRLLLGIALAVLPALTGCQNCPVGTEMYSRVIDHVADHEHQLDWVYHPGLDISRLGEPDFCACGVNRWVFGHACNQVPPVNHWNYPQPYVPRPALAAQTPGEPSVTESYAAPATLPSGVPYSPPPIVTPGPGELGPAPPAPMPSFPR